MGTDARSSLQELLPGIAEREHDDPEAFPNESVAALFDAGVIAAPFAADLGGSGSTLGESVADIEALASASPSTALIAAMPVGFAGIFALGSDVAPEQHRADFADQIVRVAAEYGESKIYAACNSEKGAGGSLDATKTTVEKGSDDVFLITGEKILASSGQHASTFVSTAKVKPEDLAGTGVVEFFLIDAHGEGVEILDDWDGFGMRATESQTVRFASAPTRELMGFPDFINVVEPLPYFYCLFAAIPLGCAKAVLEATATPTPQSPALRLRLSEAVMRYEAMRAYLLDTADQFRPSAGPQYAARVLRTKTYVSQEATKLCAELFALGGGRNYRRSGAVARALADSFAGTALRPPLSLALEKLGEEFSLGDE
ncbi:MAG: acyl-CoA dehydrogenase family protein [Solirubrobacterales bacterium]